MATVFPYAARARIAEEARIDVHESFAKWSVDGSDKSKQAWIASIDHFNAAMAAAYPPNFWTDFQRLRTGDLGGLEAAIEFLEADPMSFRSGYVKAKLLAMLGRLPLNPQQVERLRAAVLAVVRQRDGREYRRYCRFAQYIDGPELRAELHVLASSCDPDAARRAGWMLDALARAEHARRGQHRRG